ncbi:conserved hypothetical protein (probable component of SST VI cluster) [Xenorhabdus nematophila ATCC 19061]|uniref:Uncharacterized protein n=1 Tax=Xenorhabdus nematophila (strain ATCC 19061 / DSM 3370 / CCUG 14189 / LMG 1036 / NCIMB 9965 / AN6) TaxID=406817 RepID=D3VHE1_XENNA|nr:type VI secretion system-associated FHA domain protein TagH [Xenorhabdus nematophila]CBJ90586.1 conserved hypothetical protein (probable component of SST VI cluster) [Xenorhabdus nematophila ATCC 19061]CEK23423.1 conserved hypothetical protein (probable component of SST VI cluster) [Xenorhabdus nematophila AN6/1]
MMRFSIVKNAGTTQPPYLSYDFSPPGGTIGRSMDNSWVLPDEELAIARLQAIVSVSAHGECWINNQGSASEVLLNKVPLAPERQVEIRDGDMLNIGHYQIQLIDIKKNPVPPENNSQSDVPGGIWDELEHILTASNKSSPQERHQTPQAAGDNNPLIKDQPNEERNPINPLAHINPATDLETHPLRSTDPMTMFNADTPFRQENIFHDQTPTTLLQRNEKYGNQEDDKKDVDPLALFSEKPARHIKNDDPLNPILNHAVPLTASNSATASEPLFTPASQSVSTESVSHESQTSSLSSFFATPHDNQAHGTQSEGKLLASLLEGMGLKDRHRFEFDEQLMYQLGRLVSQLSQGIIVLNASRHQFKHKLDADMTQILSDIHNPFKLLPSGQSVLTLMFSDHMPGFMPLEEATHDILTELQAHQSGMIAGIRATVADILHSFHPVMLEQTAQDENYLPRLSLSSTYKASIWDYFTQHYQAISKQFEQESSLFGENFLQAYSAEVNRYKTAKK